MIISADAHERPIEPPFITQTGYEPRGAYRVNIYFQANPEVTECELGWRVQDVLRQPDISVTVDAFRGRRYPFHGNIQNDTTRAQTDSPVVFDRTLL